MNNSDKYNVRVNFNQNVSGMRLQLIDGDLNTVFDGVSNELKLQLSQGIYQLKISYLDYYQEQFFSITGHAWSFLHEEYGGVLSRTFNDAVSGSLCSYWWAWLVKLCLLRMKRSSDELFDALWVPVPFGTSFHMSGTSIAQQLWCAENFQQRM